jgi:inosine-uridine nucleoside N-ribohydrolase
VRTRHRLFALLAAVVIGGCGSPSISSPPSGSAASEPSPGSAAAPRPIIVDVDLDASDIVALAVLLREPRVDVRAILISATGLVHCAAGLRNTAYLLKQFGISGIPVACGREDAGPDGRPFPDDWRIASDSGYGMEIPPQPVTEPPEDVATVFARAVTESPQAPIIVALGPWTNIEDGLAADPALADRIAAIHAMAGTIDAPGNVLVDGLTGDDHLEWNVAADPSSYAAVLATTIPVSLVPLDATDDVPVPRDMVERLGADRSPAGINLFYELLVRYPGRMTGEGQQLWDELAALTVSDPNLVKWEDLHLSITADGRFDRSADGRLVRVAMAADRDATERTLLDALRKRPARPDPFASGRAHDHQSAWSRGSAPDHSSSRRSHRPATSAPTAWPDVRFTPGRAAWAGSSCSSASSASPRSSRMGRRPTDVPAGCPESASQGRGRPWPPQAAERSSSRRNQTPNTSAPTAGTSDSAVNTSSVTTMAICTSPSESSTTPEPRRVAIASVLSASRSSEVAFAASAPLFAVKATPMRESWVSMPSRLAEIFPTASAAEPNGVAPRMLTDRSCASSADRSARRPTIRWEAEGMAFAACSSVVLNVCDVVDAFRSAVVVRSVVVAS